MCCINIHAIVGAHMYTYIRVYITHIYVYINTTSYNCRYCCYCFTKKKKKLQQTGLSYCTSYVNDLDLRSGRESNGDDKRAKAIVK